MQSADSTATPDKSAGQGGVQLGNDDTNTYAQMTVMVSY
jgi:hypothetical protein